MKRFYVLVFLALGASHALAHGSDFDFEREMDALLARAMVSGQVPLAPGPGLEIAREPRTLLELGAVLDVRRPDPAGLPVVAVSPGSAAEGAGLRPGDRLVSVNGVGFASGEPTSLLSGALSARDGEFELAVDRGGQALALSGRADRRQLPAYRLSVAAGDPASGCGRVSTFDVAPRRQHIYPAVLIAVNGRLPGPTSSETFRLPAGRHVLRICRAEACQAVGGEVLAEATLRKLGIDWHGTTGNGALTVEPVYCLGLCANGPAAMLDERVVARLDGAGIDRLLAEAGA